MSSSGEGQSYPQWINADFLQAALEKEEPLKNAVIESISVENACPEGSGHISRLLRVTFSVREKTSGEQTKKQLIVKCSVGEGPMKAESDKVGVFKRETLALGKVIPEVHKVLAAAEGSAFRPLAPRCFRCGDQPADFLVLEDLAAEGYAMAEGGRPLDYDHCAAVLKTVARLHAASVRVLRDRPDYAEGLRADPLGRGQEFLAMVGRNLFRALADQLKASPDYSKYADRYLKIGDAAVDGALKARSNKDVQLLVMLHGDCWKNNVMFKHDAGKLTDLRLVDFQISTTGSPAVDVQHLLYTSASEQVHRERLAELLALYHGQLQSALRRLGLAAEAEAYPLDAFLREMYQAAAVGLFFSGFHFIFFSPGALAAEINSSLNQNKYSEQLCAKGYANPYSLSFLKYLTPLYEKKGLL